MYTWVFMYKPSNTPKSMLPVMGTQEGEVKAPLHPHSPLLSPSPAALWGLSLPIGRLPAGRGDGRGLHRLIPPGPKETVNASPHWGGCEIGEAGQA